METNRDELREQLRERLRQWKLANEREVQELRALSFEDAAHALGILMLASREMGPDPQREVENERVRAMWVKLRREHGVR